MVWITWQTRTIPEYNEYIVLVSLIFGPNIYSLQKNGFH